MEKGGGGEGHQPRSDDQRLMFWQLIVRTKNVIILIILKSHCQVVSLSYNTLVETKL